MTHTWKGVGYDEKGKAKDCIFCRISKREEPGTIEFEDDSFVVFRTTSPVTEKHLLVITREHIRNASDLSGPKDAELVRRLVSTGKAALGDQAPGALFCFHMSPFNSIDHLHLHAIARPETMNFVDSLKYNTWLPNCRTAESVCASCLLGADRQDRPKQLDS